MPSPISIGPWTLGKHLGPIFTIAGATVDASNNWTVSTPAVDCTGVVRRLNHQVRATFKDIRPITNPNENMVLISVGNAVQLTFIRVSKGPTSGNPISNLIATYGFVQVIFDDAKEEYNGYYAVGNYEGGFDGNEEQIQTLELQPVALVGQAQVVRTIIP